MSLFNFASWIAEERKRAREEYETVARPDTLWHRGYNCGLKDGQLTILRRLCSRLRRGR